MDRVQSLAEWLYENVVRPLLQKELSFHLALPFSLLVAFTFGGMADGQTADTSEPAVVIDTFPVRTDNPQETFRSFQRLSHEMEEELVSYLANPTFQGVQRLAILSDQMNGLIDLQSQPQSSRREIGIRTMTYLMDIFGRLPPFDAGQLPGSDEISATESTSVRIPGTPLYIGATAEGVRTGEYLFTSATVDIAPRFFRSVQHVPLRTDLPTDSFSSLGPQLTGPVIPHSLIASLPPSLTALWLDTPLWKVLISLLAAIVLVSAAVILQKAVGLMHIQSRIWRVFVNAALPLGLLLVSSVLLPAFTFQINLSGQFAGIAAGFKTLLTFGSSAWLFWLLVRLVFETIILSPRIPDASLDANLLRLVSNVIGLVGVFIILAFGGQSVGLPIVSVLAGLGIGGLAVALALRPTLENLVGGVILFLDRPVRVGDFCRFGDQMGTVEAIGVRSTKLRALDRTIIAVPNAQLADMQITNFAYCDRMLLQESLGARYETSPDQLRFLLASLRKMLHAHPRIERDTVRVRFASFGSSSFDIDLRVYVLTREWNDFFAVREDIFLRVIDLLADAGVEFAFPSQTLYLGRDRDADAVAAETAEKTVQLWRRQDKLPFPGYTAADIDRFENTLDYPPDGSAMRSADTDVVVQEEDGIRVIEPLSTRETGPTSSNR